MNFIYNIAVQVAGFLLPLVALFSKKIKFFVEGQKDIPKHLETIKKWKSDNPNKKIAWFHCASLGEFEQGRPLIEAFKERNADYGILVTFFSSSGYEVRKNYAKADFICYLPLDTKSGAERFVQTVQPEVVVFVKYEFWPNILQSIKKSGARLVGVSVILRENQAFFKPWGSFFRKILFCFDYLFVQNQKSAELLKSIDFNAFEVVGDTRFDRVLATAKMAEDVTGIADFVGNSEVMVVGSAWQEDIDVLLPFVKKHTEMKFIIAPHDIHEEQVKAWTQEMNAVRYSKFENFKSQNVLIIDSVGLLSKLYKYADYAFVGGAFKTGLHNTLEPAVFGVPIFFGNKKYKKFQEALDLIELGVAHLVNDNLEEVFVGLDLEKIKKNALAYVDENAGATQKILKYLETKN